MTIQILELNKNEQTGLFTVVVDRGFGKESYNVSHKDDLWAQLVKAQQCDSDYGVLKGLVGTTITL